MNAPSRDELRTRINKALTLAADCGQVDGAHHKAWAIDQMVRLLTGCPTVGDTTETTGEESETYLKFVREACAGEDGPDTYEWDCGAAP